MFSGSGFRRETHQSQDALSDYNDENTEIGDVPYEIFEYYWWLSLLGIVLVLIMMAIGRDIASMLVLMTAVHDTSGFCALYWCTVMMVLHDVCVVGSGGVGLWWCIVLAVVHGSGGAPRWRCVAVVVRSIDCGGDVP